MKNFIVIPDSFKGTMSSEEVCEIMEKSILATNSLATVKKIPIADGGEGTVDSFLAALGGEKIWTEVNGPYMEKMQSFYGIVNNGKTAVVELASAAGLPLVGENKNPLKTTTYGVGELILHAVKKGCNEIIVGLGGSCTNDFGAGMASALGVLFYNKNHNTFIPTGGTLKDICEIDVSVARENLKGISLTAMCDIQNPLCGENGAAYVFAPQKGADTGMVKELDEQLMYAAEITRTQLEIDCKDMAGAGAAGGAGGGILAFAGASLRSGIDIILDIVKFDDLLKDADVVFTGEGRIDNQSADGKVIAGIAMRTKKQGVPLIAVVGDILDPLDAMYDLGLTSVISINRVAVDFGIAKTRCKQDLEYTMDNIMRILSLNR